MENHTPKVVTRAPPKPRVLCKQDLLMTSLSEFFGIKENMDTLLPIVQGNSCISLRILDWFVTNYAKKNSVVYKTTKGDIFNVFLEYKSQLKGHSKKNFDPFCRRERIDFSYDPEDLNLTIETTVGQLNFFRWAIKNEVVTYVEDFLERIEADMANSVSSRKKNRKKAEENNEPQKRAPLTPASVTKTCTKRFTRVVVSFD